MEEPDITQLKGKKVQDVYTKVYGARSTIFSDQTGQFPTRSQRGNKYIMVMVEIDSNAILVEPLKSRKDPELTRAYRKLMMRLKQAGIVPKKHVLDNEVSEAMKEVIRTEYQMEMELVPPGCHRRNAAEVAIRNFKTHFSAYWRELQSIFRCHYGIDYCRKPKSQSIYCDNPMQLPQCRLMLISAALLITTKCH